jgi:hypothetical protein
MKLGLVAVLLLLASGCPHNGGYQQPASMPTVAETVDRLAKARAALTSFTGESVMDYWLGDQRVKGTVLVMGATGAKVRFNALSPAGGDVLADMACDGTNFAYVDKQHNCQLTGPCNRSSIAALLHVELEPDDFIHLALGTPPVLDQPTGTVTWDGSKGLEKVKLEGPDGTQTIDIDARDGKFDVVASELKDKSGKIVWSVENADWQAVKDSAGGEHRLPGKTRFKSPREKADLLVDWKERTANVQIAPDKFTVQVPPGLPPCGAKR